MGLYSSNGELLVKLNDGIEYLLRFGSRREGETSDDEKKQGRSEFELHSLRHSSIGRKPLSATRAAKGS